jgi:peptidoglycan-N-acetylglucosamine deacetylase
VQRRGGERTGGRTATAVAAAVVLAALIAALAGAPSAALATDPDAAGSEAVPAMGEAPPSAPDMAPDPTAPRVSWHGSRLERVVALTFDDGWNAATLRQIYRILVRERVPATFFVTGVYVQRAPDLWRQIAAAGYPLANHSYLHRDSRRLTPAQLAAELAHTRAVVEAATGRPMLAAFRPPYGDRTPATDWEVAAAGFPDIVMWDVTGGDTVRGASAASVVRDASAGRPGSIVLLHAGPRVTPRALPGIIARYRERGFRFVNLEELLGIAPVPATLSAGGRRASPSRLLDRADGDRGVAGRAAAPDAGSSAGAAAVSVPGPSGPPVTSPPARDAAWARRAGTPASVALFSVVVLALLVAAGVVAGRAAATPDGAASPDDPSA